MKNRVQKDLKNGLTAGQVQKAREILSQVSILKLCKEMKIHPTTVYNVLRDNSNRVDILKKVLEKAKAQIKRQQQLLASLPTD